MGDNGSFSPSVPSLYWGRRWSSQIPQVLLIHKRGTHSEEGRTERRYALCSVKNVTALRHGPTHWHQKLAANMSEGSRSWHERVSANTRDYFQGLIACQTQHKAGLREQHFCWSRRGWQRSRADARGETWLGFLSGTALGLCRDQLLFGCMSLLRVLASLYLQRSAYSAHGMGHLFDF